MQLDGAQQIPLPNAVRLRRKGSWTGLRDVFAPMRRPPAAFMWDGASTPFYQRWWLKVNGEDGEAFSIQVVANNPWDTAGEFENTGVYIFFDRFRPVDENNRMSMPDNPLEDFSANRTTIAQTVYVGLFWLKGLGSRG